MEPLEVVGAPYTIYIALVGEAFPAIDDDPPGGTWALLGTSGTKSYSGPVTMQENMEGNPFIPEGSTLPRKWFPTEETRIVTASVADLTLETFKHGLNQNAIMISPPTTTTQGFRTIGLTRGLHPVQLSLLVRGIGLSPYLEGADVQWQIPRCIEMASRSIDTQKGEPALIEFEFFCLEDLDAASEAEAYGTLVAADTEPS